MRAAIGLLLGLLACTAGDDKGGAGGDSADGSAADGGAGADGAGDGGDDGGAAAGGWFPEGAVWTTPVTDAATDPRSGAVIDALQAHGWGLGRFQIDFSIEVLRADASTEARGFTPTGDFYSPDCDAVPVPVPPGARLEGETGTACEGDGDCHLIVHHVDEGKLYEMWRADIRGEDFRGGCLAVWDLGRVYPPEGRGLQCTSADAAGYPIAPLLFTAEEVAAGEIAHAIRFILPNSAIRDGEFYAPASHATNADGGGPDAVPYGARLRLKADFDESLLPTEGARVVARALKAYGMLLADGGNVALTAAADTDSAQKWEGLLGSRDLEAIQPRDFELMELGEAVPLTFDCARNGL